MLFERGSFQGRVKTTDKGRTADRNRELVPDNWSLARERALTIVHCAEGLYSEQSGVCRRDCNARKEYKGKKYKV